MRIRIRIHFRTWIKIPLLTAQVHKSHSNLLESQLPHCRNGDDRHHVLRGLLKSSTWHMTRGLGLLAGLSHHNSTPKSLAPPTVSKLSRSQENEVREKALCSYLLPINKRSNSTQLLLNYRGAFQDSPLRAKEPAGLPPWLN